MNLRVEEKVRESAELRFPSRTYVERDYFGMCLVCDREINYGDPWPNFNAEGCTLKNCGLGKGSTTLCIRRL